jgi:hypothetical protein
MPLEQITAQLQVIEPQDMELEVSTERSAQRRLHLPESNWAFKPKRRQASPI